MKATAINPRLVIVERPLLLDLYVERTALGFWVNAKTGRAVCPVVRAAIEKQVRR